MANRRLGCRPRTVWFSMRLRGWQWRTDRWLIEARHYIEDERTGHEEVRDSFSCASFLIKKGMACQYCYRRCFDPDWHDALHRSQLPTLVSATAASYRRVHPSTRSTEFCFSFDSFLPFPLCCLTKVLISYPSCNARSCMAGPQVSCSSNRSRQNSISTINPPWPSRLRP